MRRVCLISNPSLQDCFQLTDADMIALDDNQVFRYANKYIMTEPLAETSKFLSFVLRHKPEAIGLVLDPYGWANIDDLIEKTNASGKFLDHATLLRVVDKSEKKRFTLSPDSRRIRAAQGHSTNIVLGLAPQVPPALLYHGTATRFVDSILAEGLKPQSRQQVHLSVDADTALRVGQRHGKPIVLEVEALRMHAKGFQLFVADNSVWLTDHVPPEFLHISSRTR